MKKLLVIIGIAVVLFGVTTLALRARERKATEATGVHQSNPVMTAPAVKPAVVPVPRFVERPEAKQPDKPLYEQLTFSGPTMRPEETESMYQSRMETINGFEAFVKDAHLTAQQREELRRAMIDTAANFHLAYTELKAQGEVPLPRRTTDRHYTRDELKATLKPMKTAMAEARAQQAPVFERRMREILTAEQMAFFEKTRGKYGMFYSPAIVTTAHVFEPVN